MRRWFLVPLLSLASAALAQQEPVPAAPPPAATPPAATPPSANSGRLEPSPGAHSVPAADPKTGLLPGMFPQPEANGPADLVRLEAGYLFDHLLTGDVRGSLNLLSFPFQLEDKRFEVPETLVAAWVKELRNKRTDLITLYGIEVLPYAEMEKKYGKPPARLGVIIPKGTEVYAAVANLSGHAAVILYRQNQEADWRAFAYTD